MAGQAPDVGAPTSSLKAAAATYVFQVGCGGALGVGFGGMVAYLNKQPMSFMVSAYGSNAVLFSAAYFGLRNGMLLMLDGTRQRREVEFIASTSAGAIVGGAFTAVGSGVRKSLTGALLWSGVAYAGQFATHKVQDWRSRKLAQIEESRQLWAHLTSEQRVAFKQRILNQQTLVRSNAFVHVSTMTSDAVTQAPSIDVLPSLRDFVDDLRDAGELVAIPLLPAAAPVAVELVGGASVEAPDCAARTGAAAPPTVASVAAGTAAANRAPEGKKGEGFDWSWFPLHLSSTDTQRLDRLKSRLQEIDEALGLAWPAVDENGRSLPPGSRPIQPPARVVAANASPASTAGASLA